MAGPEMNNPTRLFIGALAVAGIAVLTSVGAARADGFDALRNDAEVENGVLIVAIADIIRDNCPNFEDRRSRSLPFLFGLVNRARSLGYSRAEIETYIANPADRERVEARARSWMVQQGADLEQPETVCQVARDEITNETVIGRLIRER